VNFFAISVTVSSQEGLCSMELDPSLFS